MTKTNLELLWEAEKDLSFDDKRRLEDYFLGAISVYADSESWQKALDGATEHIKRVQAERTQAVTK